MKKFIQLSLSIALCSWFIMSPLAAQGDCACKAPKKPLCKFGKNSKFKKDVVIEGKLCVAEATTFCDVVINGDLITKKWIIPLSDNLENPPSGSALVYVNVEESYSVPPLPTGQFPVILRRQFEDDVSYITVTQVGSHVDITLGDGNPSQNLVWSQDEDYTVLANIAPLVIDFSNTPVADLILHGGNQVILTIPHGYTADYISETGIAQIGGANPIIKLFPYSQPTVFQQATLDESGSVTVNAPYSVTNDPRFTNIQLTYAPGGVGAPAGHLYVSGINDYADFTISSSAGSSDAGRNVYYALKGPIQWYYRGWPNGTNAVPAFTATAVKLDQ